MKNRRTFLRIFFSVLFTLLLCVTMTACDCAGCSSCGGNEPEFIEMGLYPQTVKSADVTVSETPDADGYYVGSDEAKYFKFVATPSYDGQVLSDGTTIVAGEEYFFKLEPIVWRVVDSTEDGVKLLVCEKIIDAYVFDDVNSNYKDSSLRAWLNDATAGFITCFTTEDIAKINTYNVTNGVDSTNTATGNNPFVCDDTQDKVFALSYNETVNAILLAKKDLDKKATDFAIARGVVVNYTMEGSWWLRSPSNVDATRASIINFDGLSEDVGVNTVHGIVPAIEITIQ